MRLFIRIVSTTPADLRELVALEWLLVDRQGALVSQGSGNLEMLDELLDLRRTQDPADVVLLVPAEHCLSMRCTVPGRTLGQMRRALPYVVEEFIAGDIETMHVAAGPLRRNSPVDVVLIDHAMLRSWIETFTAHGVVVAFAAPDAAMLPAKTNEVTLLFDGARVLVRSNDQVAAIEAGALKLVLESFAAKAPPEGLRCVAVNGRIAEVMRAEVAQATENRIEWIDAESELTALAHLAAAYPGEPPAINLLQGVLAPPTQGAGGLIRWRAVAALLGIWLVVLVASETVRGAWAAHRARALTSDIETLYRSYFPQDKRVQDPYKQMRAHLGGHGDADSTFLSLLGHLAAGLAANPTAQLRSVTFNDGRAELGAEVAVGAFDALESLKAAWGKEGVAVDISSAEQQDQQVHARIRLRGS